MKITLAAVVMAVSTCAAYAADSSGLQTLRVSDIKGMSATGIFSPVVEPAAALMDVKGGTSGYTFSSIVKSQEITVQSLSGLSGAARGVVRMGKQATYSGYDKYETREEALGAQAALVDKFKQSGIPVLGSTVNQRYIDGKFRISVKYLAKVSVISKKVFSSDAYRAEADARADMAKNVSELKKAGCIINATKVVEGVDSDGLLYAFRIDYTEEKPTLLTDEYISKANTDQAAAVVEAIVGALSSKGVVVLESSSQPTPRVSYIAKDLDMWTLTSPQSRDIATAKADLAKQIADLRSRGALMVEAYLESVNSFMPPHSTAVFIRGDNMPEPKTIMVPAAEFDERLNQLKAENATILMIDRGIYSSVVYIPAK